MAYTPMHLYGLILTLLVVAGIGLYSAKKIKTAGDYTVGGRRASASLVAGGIAGTVMGGAATIGTAQLAFLYGFAAWWYALGAGLGLLLLGLLYAKPLRASGLETIPQFLVTNYGRTAGPIISITSSIGIFFSIVANFLSAIPLMSVVFSVDIYQSAGVVLALSVAYVFFGGVWGVGMVGIVKTALLYVNTEQLRILQP
ncbi:Cation/acetate symporter ActP [Sporomusa carbonis]|uniref:sodium:solute symporter family transporter n=1 Tax=Sporomusa carbonis TaxID=3076075 RepID=UPI003A79B177